MDECWWEVALARATQLREASGTITQLAHTACSLFTTWRDTGLPLTCIDGHAFTLFARFRICLADVTALKELYCNKGHGGLKPCLLCANAVAHFQPGKKKSEAAPGLWTTSDYAVSIQDDDFSRFRRPCVAYASQVT